MSAAERKRNQRKRKIELMNDDEKIEYRMRMNKQRSQLRRKQLTRVNKEDLARRRIKDCERKREWQKLYKNNI